MSSRDPQPGPLRSMAQGLATVLRAGLTVIAVAIVLWAFVHVGTRPLRQHRELGDRIELTVLHWGDRDEDRITQSLVDSFERANPGIRIKRINAGANYPAKLQTMIASGEPPDVFFLNDYQIPTYASRGILMDVEPLIERDEASGDLPFSMDDMFDEAIEGFRFDGERLGQGTLYGVPMSFTPMGFYYNRDMFREAGLDEPSEDWTWDDFERTARALHERLGVVGAAIDLRGAMLPRLMAWSEGTDLVTEDFERVRTEDERVREVLERIRRWGADRGPYRLFGDAQQEVETGSGVFMAERAAMYGPIGRWMVPVYRQLEGVDWDFATLPRGRVRQNMLYIAAWCIAADTEHPEEAWAVARHFATPEGQRINAGLGLALPTLRSVAESEAFTNPDVRPRSDGVYLRAVEGSRPMAWPLNTRLTVMMRNAMDSAMRTQTATIDEALARLQSDFDRARESPLGSESFPRMPWRWVTLAIVLPSMLLAAFGARRWWRGRPGTLARGTEYSGVLMVSPWILGLSTFIAIPIVISLLLAFTRWSGLATLEQAEWVGLANFREIFGGDPRFVRAVIVTFAFALIAVPAGQAVALGAAMLMSNPVPGVNAFRAMWYLPTVLAGVAMAVMWWWVFDAEYGLANSVLRPILGIFGLRAPEWFGADASWAGVIAFSVTSIWTFGGAMLIYLAGLNAIPRHLYEAAEIDGARWHQRFRNVTLPMLSPVILFNLVISVIASFQVFTQAYVMTKGGPNDATLFYVLYLYEEAFEHHNMGYASALAWILFLVVLAMTGLVMWASKRRVHYEGAAL